MSPLPIQPPKPLQPPVAKKLKTATTPQSVQDLELRHVRPFVGQLFASSSVPPDVLNNVIHEIVEVYLMIQQTTLYKQVHHTTYQILPHTIVMLLHMRTGLTHPNPYIQIVKKHPFITTELKNGTRHPVLHAMMASNGITSRMYSNLTNAFLSLMHEAHSIQI